MGDFTDDIRNSGKQATRQDREFFSYSQDLDGKITKRVLVGKQLENLFNLINSAGFLDGESYDGFLLEENPITKFKTFHFFNQGSEEFSIALGFNSDTDIGALKTDPPASISRFFFVQGLNLGSEPIGSTMGALFAVGGSNVTFTILQDLLGFFAIESNNLITSLTEVPEGEYDLVIKAEGISTQYIDQVKIIVLATALISNINLSNVIVEGAAPIGTSVGALTTTGGENPTMTILAQVDDLGDPVDIFEISGNTLQTKSAVGLIGDTYRLFIQAEDSRSGLPDNERIKVEEFVILVVANSFLNSNSLSFNAVDEYIDIPNDISMWGNQNFSGSMWINANSKGSGHYILSKFEAAGKRSWAIRVNTAGTIAIVYSQTGVASDTTTTVSSITFGVWTHIAFAFDGTLGQPKMKIWIDSVLDVDEDTVLTSLYNNSTIPMYIGALNQPLPTLSSAHFDGNIDEVSIYNSSLSQSEVEDIYNLGSPVNIESLSSGGNIISWWRMGDNFSANMQPDSVGSNDGLGINMNNSNRSVSIP